MFGPEMLCEVKMCQQTTELKKRHLENWWQIAEFGRNMDTETHKSKYREFIYTLASKIDQQLGKYAN